MRYLGRYHFLRTGVPQTRLIGLVAVFILVIGFAVLTTSGQPDFATQALDYVAGQEGIAIEKLQIVTSTQAHLPLTKVDLAEFKVISSEGQSFGVSFNVATQQVVEPLVAAEKERQARLATFGVVDPVLFDRL